MPTFGLSLELNEVYAGYAGAPVIADISLKIEPGDFVGVIGPNGSGKSTLLKVMVGLLKPASGQVLINGEHSQASRKKIGFLPQLTQIDFNFPASVWDVVMMGRFGKLGLGRAPGKEDILAVREALAKVGLSDLASLPIGKLSGGQRQRAFIARAISGAPGLLILDEPIAGVDITSQHALLHLLEELNAQGITIVSSTHDLNCVASSFNRVICLNHKLIAQGSPENVLTPDILNQTFGSHLLLVADNKSAYFAHNDLGH